MKKLIYLLPLLFFLTSCGVFDSGESEEIIEYQMIVHFNSDEPMPGFAPRWVYVAVVDQSNRLTPNTVLLDFTDFVNNGQGQLPTDLVDHSFNVTAELQDDNTYLVTNSFTAF